MSLYKRSDADDAPWWYRFEVAGVEFRGSTNTADRALALSHEATKKLEERAKAPLRSSKRGLGRLRALGVEDYQAAEDRGVSPGYLRFLRWAWRAIDDAFGPGATVADVTFDSVTDYIAKRRRAGIRGQSIRREVAALKRVCAAAARRRWIVAPPSQWPTVKSNAPHPKRRGKLHPPEKILAVLADLPPDARDEYRFAALTGLRAAELARVEASWMEATEVGPILRVPAWASKTRQERVVSLSAPAVEILRRRSRRSPIFSGSDFQQRVGTLSKRHGLTSRLTLRDLRVYYATQGLSGSGDAAAVQAALGHQDLRTTQVYQRTTLERAAAVSAAAARGLQGRHAKPGTRRKVRKSKGKSRVSVAWQGTRVVAFRDVECPECAAEIERIRGDCARGRHIKTGTREVA